MQHSLYKDRFLNLQSKIQIGKALLSPIDTTLFSTIIKKYDLNINSEKRNTTNENQTVIRHRHKRKKSEITKTVSHGRAYNFFRKLFGIRDDMMDNAENFRSM